MSEYKPIQDLNIPNDSFLVKWIKEEAAKIEFVNLASNLIRDLREDVELHLQGNTLIQLWKQLVGDAIIFLKSKDDRERYHDQMALGAEKLRDFLSEFQNFESILYGAVPHYRDHIAHVFRVFLLGQYIIKHAIGFENITPKMEEMAISPEEKEAIWSISALTHDLGLALEQIHEINQKVRRMLQKFGNIPVQELGYRYFTQFGNISEFGVRFLSSNIIRKDENNYYTHLQAKYYQKFLSALSGFNHGVISSVILMKDLVYFKESDYMLDTYKPLKKEDARQFLIRKEILRAIASHSCDDIYYLKITNFPFLLTLCDEMQEWGRPRLVDITKRGESITELTINRFSDKAVDYRISFGWGDFKPSMDERNYAAEDVKGYFVKKCKKWLNVLRSAVGGRQRALKLNFRVEDKTHPTIKKYSLEHTTPKNFKILPKEMRDQII